MKMRFVSWLVGVVVLCGSVVQQCQGLGSQDSITDCSWRCRLKQEVTRRSPHSDEDHQDEDAFSLMFSALVSSSLQAPGVRPHRGEDRPHYSMEHFRWGKPTGRKRRPVKVHAPGSPDDEGQDDPETPPTPPSRRQLDEGRGEGRGEEEQKNAKAAERYRMTHFRWSAPPAAKRYGGFMRPEISHNSLLTLLRNVIVRDGQ